MNIVLIIIASALLLTGIGFYRKRQNAVKAKREPFQFRIQDMQIGGVFQIQGGGKNGEDLDLHVEKKHIYKESNFSWFELVCNSGNETLFLEVEDDDELLLYLTTDKMTLGEIGLSKNDLTLIANNEKGNCRFKDHSFKYTESGTAKFYKNGEGSGENFSYWDFRSEDGNWFIGAEMWPGDNCSVSFGEIIKPSRINIYNIKEEKL